MQQNLRGADLGARAGVSVRTVTRAEAGENTSLESLVKILRALGRLDALDNHLLMGDYNGNLHSFKMRRNGRRVKKERTIYSTGGILDVAKGPGGWPYFMTSSGMFRIVKK